MCRALACEIGGVVERQTVSQPRESQLRFEICRPGEPAAQSCAIRERKCTGAVLRCFDKPV